MRKWILIIWLVISSISVFAQKEKVSSALTYKESGNLKKAYEEITLATNPNNAAASESINWPYAWQVRGEIIQEIYRQRVPGIVENPLFKAFEAYKKAIELDTDSKYSKSIVGDLIFIQTDFSNFAVTSYQKENYTQAMQGFECFVEISNMQVMSNKRGEVIDTSIIYNTALAAYKAKNWEKAITYFNKSIDNNFNGAISINYIYEAFQAKGDTLSAITYLKNGFEKYPDDETILVQLVRFYMIIKNNETAIEYLDLAISKNPNTAGYYVIKGSTLENIGDKDAAIENYRKAIEIDTTQFTPYYNIGVICFNNGVNALNEAGEIQSKSGSVYEKKIEMGKAQLLEAMPCFEKAYEIDSSKTAILGSLRLIYYRLQMMQKFNAVNEKLSNR